jgi:hypothetical protein
VGRDSLCDWLDTEVGELPVRGPPSGNPRAPLGNHMSDEDQILSRTKVLALLSQKAREGSTSAMIALERALRAREHDMQDVDDEIERIIRGCEG